MELFRPEVERRRAVLVPRLEVRAEGDEDRDDVAVQVERGAVQRGPPGAAASVDLGSGGEEGFDDGRVAVFAGGAMQERFAGLLASAGRRVGSDGAHPHRTLVGRATARNG